ncbi:MAG: 2-phospho-L-lactate guanylyltransferase [Pseudomonadota bacterium]
MKDPARSKTRLRVAMSCAPRAAVARRLLRRTLDLMLPLRDASVCDLAVVTVSAEVKAQARERSIPVIEEGSEDGLNMAVGTAATYACRQGYDALCVLPADLVAPDPEDIRSLIEHRAPNTVTVCPSVDMGTNALVVSPPDGIDFCYGPCSAQKHVAAAHAAGYSARMIPLESLRHDLDTADHLSRATALVPELVAL